MFGDDFPEVAPVRKKFIRKETKVMPIIVDLWRGFNGNLKDFEYDEKNYLFSPEYGEQGMLWFTSLYCSCSSDPIEYAKGNREWLTTHKINCKRHIQTNYFDDNSKNEGLPDYWDTLADPSTNCRYYLGIELPEGWVFTSKVQKFIGCKHNLLIPKTSVVPIDNQNQD